MAKPSKDKKKSKSTVNQPSEAQPAGTSPTSKKENKKAAVKGGLRTAKRKKAPEPKGMDLSMFRTKYSEGDRMQTVGSAKTQVMGASGKWETELDHKALMKTLKNWLNSSVAMVKQSQDMSKEDWQKFVEEADWSDITKNLMKYLEFRARLRSWDREGLAEIADTLTDLIDEKEAKENERTKAFLEKHKDLMTPLERELLGMEEAPKVQEKKTKTKPRVKATAKATVKTKTKVKARAEPKAKETGKAKAKAKETGKAKAKAKTKKG